MTRELPAPDAPVELGDRPDRAAIEIADEVLDQLERHDAVLPSDAELGVLAQEVIRLTAQVAELTARLTVATRRLSERRQLYVSERVTRQFAHKCGINENDLELARRRLTALLRDAHPTERSPGIWRVRDRRPGGVDLSVRVDLDEGDTRLLIATGIIGDHNLVAKPEPRRQQELPKLAKPRRPRSW